MKPTFYSRYTRGFSLIEVLIAVVVLSFGLLALAALQSRLIQASADAKAQSVAISLAKDKLEDLRGFLALAGACGTAPANYQCINSSTAAETLADSSGSLGGVNFSRSWTVARYAVATSGTNFTLLPATNNTGALPSGYVANNEFKVVRVNVGWVDAKGQSNTVTMEDAIAGLDPQDTSRALRTRVTRPRGPEVTIYNPASEEGVIPIAIGNNTDTAATNPKPVVAGRTSGGSTAIETRFDVLTYSALTGGNALAQARVETTVVGCRCDTANAPASNVKAYRPVFWNGFRYAAPVVASYAPLADAATLGNNDPPQSRYCTACCRNHHDPSGLSADAPRFSPRRSPHNHYRIVNGALVAANSGEYLETCRLIRADGIFDVAADLYNDHVNLLETRSLALNSTTGSAPSDNATRSYQDFVTKYLGQRYANGSNATYNTVETTPSRSQLAAAAVPQSLSTPTEAGIARSSDQRWMHSRGLYVDHLEKDARDALTEAKSKCSSPTQLVSCALRVLPFTSINVTELAVWTVSNASQLAVTNADFASALLFDEPIRGKATPVTPAINDRPTSTATIGLSNSGIALYPAVNPDEGTGTTTQQFVVTSGGPPAGGDQLTVQITLAGLPNYVGGARIPVLSMLTGLGAGVCSEAGLGSATYPYPYTCTGVYSGGLVELGATRYNYQAQQSFQGSVTCTKQGGSGGTASLTINRTDRPVCKNFVLQSATAPGLPGTASLSGRMDESTRVSYSSLTSPAAVTFTFADETAALSSQPLSSEYTCTYNGNSPSQGDFSWNPCP